METKKEIMKVSEMVEEILKEDERSRNDDTWLIYKVCRKITNIFIPYEDFKKLPAFETITRVRRKFQNKDNKYLPTSKDVRFKRGIREVIFREEFKY